MLQVATYGIFALPGRANTYTDCDEVRGNESSFKNRKIVQASWGKNAFSCRVAENSTLAQQEFNRAFVLMQYFGYLRRNPNDPPEATLDFQGYNFWLNKLDSFHGDFNQAEMVKAFIGSSEYQHRFGQ